MAIYHLTVKAGSKAKGQSAKAKSDYISREGKYQKDADEVLHLSSGNMPQWAENEPKKYWEAADTYERANGSIFREVEFALPVELSRADKIALADSFAQELAGGELPYTFAVHRGEDQNPHCHLMLSERVNDGHDRPAADWFRRAANKGKAPETGGAPKSAIGKNAANRKAWLLSTRKMWADRANAALERAGVDAAIDHRSYSDQGVDKIPGIHLSLSVIEMEGRGIQTDRAEIAAEIMAANIELEELHGQANRYGADLESQRKPKRGSVSRAGGAFSQGAGGLGAGHHGDIGSLGQGSRVTARDLERFDAPGPGGSIIEDRRDRESRQEDDQRRQADQLADSSRSRGRWLDNRDSSRSRILDYAQGSLHQEQGVRDMETARRPASDRRLTAMKKHITAKEKSWDRQAAALDSPAYRITLTDPLGMAKPWNMGKGQGSQGQEEFYTKEEVKDLIPTLSAKNAQGRNIFITPIDEDHHYLVLDDSSAAQVDELKQHGFKPALTQESSPGNVQAIFKIPRVKNSVTEQKAANNVVQRLNKEFGDPNFSGVIHPFRMAGFTNPKPKHKDRNGNFPFVQIKTAQGGLCERMAQAMENPRIEKATVTRKAIIKAVAEEKKQVDGLTSAEHAFCRAWHKVKGLAVAKGWPLDNSKIDFRVCKELLGRYRKEIVKAALVKVSPSIETRHSDLKDYAHRTVECADQDRIQEQAKSKKQRRGMSMGGR